jgi:hypothetical protein
VSSTVVLQGQRIKLSLECKIEAMNRGAGEIPARSVGLVLELVKKKQSGKVYANGMGGLIGSSLYALRQWPVVIYDSGLINGARRYSSDPTPVQRSRINVQYDKRHKFLLISLSAEGQCWVLTPAKVS